MSAPQHPWFIDSRKNLIVVRLPPKPTNDEVLACTTAMERFQTKNQLTSAWVADLTQLAEITAAQRKMFADHEQRVAHLTKLNVSRLAYVVSNPIIRAALTAFFWICVPPYPHRVFADRAAAEAWALGITP
jgi:hypothetical protein